MAFEENNRRIPAVIFCFRLGKGREATEQPEQSGRHQKPDANRLHTSTHRRQGQIGRRKHRSSNRKHCPSLRQCGSPVPSDLHEPGKRGKDRHQRHEERREVIPGARDEDVEDHGP